MGRLPRFDRDTATTRNRREHAIIGGANRVATPASPGCGPLIFAPMRMVCRRRSSCGPHRQDRPARSMRTPAIPAGTARARRISVEQLVGLGNAEVGADPCARRDGRASGRASRRGRNCSTPRKPPESRVRQFDGGAKVCDRDSCELETPDPRPAAVTETQRTVDSLIAEAIDDLAAKYGRQPATPKARAVRSQQRAPEP